MGDDIDAEMRRKFPRGYIAKVRRILKEGKLDEDGKLMADGTIVLDAAVVATLNDLIQLDIDATEKIGAGIDHWEIYSNRDRRRNSSGYRIMRVDGTGPVPFGYGDVLRPPTRETYVHRALNDEVADLMIQFRRSQFEAGPVYCLETQVLIGDFLNSKAVHVSPTCNELHSAFLTNEGLTYGTIGLTKRGLPQGGYLLEDRTLAARWVEFQRARLDGVGLQYMDRFDR
jgi:hypothetical protein